MSAALSLRIVSVLHDQGFMGKIIRPPILNAFHGALIAHRGLPLFRLGDNLLIGSIPSAC
jgi:hypothetical protein